MAINLSGSDYSGSGEYVQLDPGTYPATLTGATIYQNLEWKDDPADPDVFMVQVGLIWDTGLVLEKSDGTEFDAIIYDDWLRFSLNEKANLAKRLQAIIPGLDLAAAAVTVETETGLGDLEDAPYWRDGKEKITTFDINGESIFGKEALVTIKHNDKGYVKVVSVTPPLQTSGKAKQRRPVGAPA